MDGLVVLTIYIFVFFSNTSASYCKNVGTYVLIIVYYFALITSILGGTKYLIGALIFRNYMV